ncbi:hypothetical protein [Streptomyces collinus]|uniref:hypothetical protein n=1 Tax=Streptomyces collinus TaxID=42684 RepID=UPI0036CC1880
MRYLPKTDVRLWEETPWYEELPVSTPDDDAVISLFVDVMEVLKERRITTKAQKAYKEFKAQMKEEVE